MLICAVIYGYWEISEKSFVNFCFKESHVDAGEVQEKVKEVICKTITNIPLSEASSRDRLNSDAVSWHFYFCQQLKNSIRRGFIK